MTWGNRRQILLGAVTAVIAVLAGRLFVMQVIQSNEYKKIATENRIRILPITAPRGTVFDRNGVPLVNNRLSFAISVLRPDFRGDQARVRLASILHLDKLDLDERLERRTGLPLEPIGIVRDADFRTICRLQEHLDDFPGVIAGDEHVREYPTAGWAGHVLGYVREISPDAEPRKTRTGAPLRGLVGAVGIEKQYDDLLRGEDGVHYMQMNAYGQLVGAMPGFKDVPPIPGSDIMLALDYRLQVLADSLLSSHLAGTVVALDVKTGGVLCFVTRPGYDANAFSGVLSSTEWEDLRDDPLHPLLNRAIKGVYSPGSTFKLLTAAAALEAGAVRPSDRFHPCYGGYRFGNRIFHCAKKEGHGSLDLMEAIEQSCNIYFYQLVQRIDIDRWARTVRSGGFGEVTGIDIPNEGAGLVPDREYYDKRFGKNKWSKGLLLNLAIGQGELLVTPLQLAQHYAAIANGGTAMKPRFLLAVRDPNGSWKRTPSEVAFRLPYPASTLSILQEAARLVVQGSRGTARGINDPDVRMAGKTGTAQNPHGNEHSWFVGYAPSENPQIVVVALVENAGHGSVFSAPICLQIANAYLNPEPLPSDLAAEVPTQ
jgi:penicillin-binding protein 2